MGRKTRKIRSGDRTDFSELLKELNTVHADDIRDNLELRYDRAGVYELYLEGQLIAKGTFDEVADEYERQAGEESQEDERELHPLFFSILEKLEAEETDKIA